MDLCRIWCFIASLQSLAELSIAGQRSLYLREHAKHVRLPFGMA